MTNARFNVTARVPVHISHHLFAPFFFDATTLKLPLLSSLVGSFGGPFLATSLQPPDLSTVALCGLALFGGTEVSINPLSASFFRRMNSSAKCRESMVLEAPWTASVMMSASCGSATRLPTNSSAVPIVSRLSLDVLT